MVSKNGPGAHLSALREASDRFLRTIDLGVARVLDRPPSRARTSRGRSRRPLRARGSDNVNAIALAATTCVAAPRRRRHVHHSTETSTSPTSASSHCTFCAFSRTHREEEGYYLPTEEIVRRAREAWSWGQRRSACRPACPQDEGRLLHRAHARHQERAAGDAHPRLSRRRRCCTARSAPVAASKSI